ncbi:MAG: hypothetical protein FWF79_08605 [Defluviitaleaceae bacterium]|nr:hypothetical protein [Defluviitaleaceae bacterium]
MTVNNFVILLGYPVSCMKTHADKTAACHKMKVSSDEVENAVMTTIKKQAEAILACDDLAGFRKTSTDERQMEVYAQQLSRLSEQRQRCYERFLANEVDRDTFHAQKAKLTGQIDRLTNQLAVLKQAQREKSANEKVAALADEALNETATPKDIVNALVEKVFIFPNNHIEIRWKFANFAI